MKKYTNKILVIGLSILAAFFIGFFVYVFHWIKTEGKENQEIDDPMVMTSTIDEDGNLKITAEYNGKTMVIDPNSGKYEEVKAEIPSSLPDTAE